MSRLLFLCGFSSGGTDLAKTILNAHPSIHISDEIPCLHCIGSEQFGPLRAFTDLQDVRKFQERLRELDYSFGMDNLDYDFTMEMRERSELSRDEILKRWFSKGDTLVWGAKAPAKLSQIGDYARLFPDARFLIVARDVRDVCLSWHNKWGKDMIWCAAKWAERMSEGRKQAEGVGKRRCLFVKFEDFLMEAETVCKRICAFLDIPHSDRMYEHQLYTDPMPGKNNYGRAIDSTNMNKWRAKLPAKTVKRIEEIAGETMMLYGYTRETVSKPRKLTEIEKFRGLVRDSCSMIFIGNRASPSNNFKERLRTMTNLIRAKILRKR